MRKRDFVTIKSPRSILVDQSGQSLVEALAALTVAVIVIVALIGLGIASMRSANLAKNNATAAKIANRDMEIAISIADDDWDALPEDNGSQSFHVTTSPPYSIVAGEAPIENIFLRKLNIEDLSGDEKEFTVTVSFITASGTHDTILRTYVTNWH